MTSFYKSIFLIIPTLITFLQLMYQTNANNPFTTHPFAMDLAVCASLIFYLAYSGQLALFMRCHSATCLVMNRCIVWSGNALVAAMASLLIPGWLRPVLYAAFVLISAADLARRLWKKLLDGSVQLYHRRRCWFCRSIHLTDSPFELPV